jgi:hypothetical protein
VLTPRAADGARRRDDWRAEAVRARPATFDTFSTSVEKRGRAHLVATIRDLFDVSFGGAMDPLGVEVARRRLVYDEIARRELAGFAADHARQELELGAGIVTRARVVLASVEDDVAILEALRRNEDEAVGWCERALREAEGPRRELLERWLACELRHRAWLDARIRSQRWQRSAREAA